MVSQIGVSRFPSFRFSFPSFVFFDDPRSGRIWRARVHGTFLATLLPSDNREYSKYILWDLRFTHYIRLQGMSVILYNVICYKRMVRFVINQCLALADAHIQEIKGFEYAKTFAAPFNVQHFAFLIQLARWSLHSFSLMVSITSELGRACHALWSDIMTGDLSAWLTPNDPWNDHHCARARIMF